LLYPLNHVETLKILRRSCMKRLSPSTWVLITLVLCIAALAAALWILKPVDFPLWHDREKAHAWVEQRWKERFGDVSPEKLKELWPHFHHFGRGWARRPLGRFHVSRPYFWGFPVIGIFVVGGIAALIIIALKNRKQRRESGEKSALEELEEQFAQGEIDEQEFKRRRAVLREERKEI
jgi:uncharacterized membrane protein